jgi:molecular chaperone DnaK
MPQIEVTFDIDANGILNVAAKDKATGKEQKITITSSSGLSKDEVEKMAKDAESHSADDQRRRDLIEARNRADSMIYNTEKTLREHRSKVSDEDAKRIEEAIEATKKSMQAEDPAEVNSALEKLTQASHKLAEAMYQSASSGPAPGATDGASTDGAAGGEASGEAKEDVVDAEFVDVDDKSKS